MPRNHLSQNVQSAYEMIPSPGALSLRIRKTGGPVVGMVFRRCADQGWDSHFKVALTHGEMAQLIGTSYETSCVLGATAATVAVGFL